MYILVEYAPHGDLLGYLRASKASDGFYENVPNQHNVNNPLKRLNYFARDIACGMEFLALNKVWFCIFCKLICIVWDKRNSFYESKETFTCGLKTVTSVFF